MAMTWEKQNKRGAQLAAEAIAAVKAGDLSALHTAALNINGKDARGMLAGFNYAIAAYLAN